MSTHERTTWVLLAGEYPPQHGGVADYTHALARELAASGDDVHVYAPPAGAPDEAEAGITVHRLADAFGPLALPALRRALVAHRPPRAAVVQYVPQSFGLRGCNIPFAASLRRLTGYPLFVMFHEVSVTVRTDTPLKYRLQAVATRRMAHEAIRAADAIFVSTPVWEPLIRRLGPPRVPIDWTPVCSNVALRSDPDVAAAIRERFGGGRALVGHFGTYREAFTCDRLRGLVPRLAVDHAVLLLGRGGERFAAAIEMDGPGPNERVGATGGLEAQALADHLAACDVLVQPFEDGLTTRRSSVTAALALGVPVVTTCGPDTEAVWETSGAVAFAEGDDHDALLDAVGRVLADGERRAELSAQSRALYAQKFAIGLTADALRARRTALGTTRAFVA